MSIGKRSNLIKKRKPSIPPLKERCYSLCVFGFRRLSPCYALISNPRSGICPLVGKETPTLGQFGTVESADAVNTTKIAE